METTCQYKSTAIRYVDEHTNRFALDLYQETLGLERQNFVFSPISIVLTLSILEVGARSTTFDEFFESIGVSCGPSCKPGITDFQLYTALFHDLHDSNALELVNKVYIEKGYTNNVSKAYTNKIKCFGPSFDSADFKKEPDLTRRVINKHVEEKTKNKIKDLLPKEAINKKTKLILVNAVHFKANWREKFSSSEIVKRKFKLANGEQRDMEFIHPDTYYHFFYLSESFKNIETKEEIAFKILGIPYKDEKFDMFIILPEDMEKFLAGKMQTFLPSYINKATREGLKNQGDVYVPKFSLDYTMPLTEVLKAAGIKTAFEPKKADLSGIAGDPGDLSVTGAFHKAFIEVDEKGTEGAAASAVVVGLETTAFHKEPPPAVFSFLPDKPFIFLVRHRQTHAIVFLGTIEEPPQFDKK